MIKYFLFLIFICSSIPLTAQSKQFVHYTSVDQNGKVNTFYKTQKVSVEEEMAVSKSIMEDVERRIIDEVPLYEAMVLNYSNFQANLEKVTGRKFEDKIFLLEYNYVEDRPDIKNNILDRTALLKRKEFTTLHKKEIEKRNKNVIILNFYEEGFSISNSPNSRWEYFFVDKGNILRKTLFTNSDRCCSFALVKPNGETLIRNGESGAWYIEQHLKPQIWELFFPKE